jgi:23S rRNA (cytosine1962-C5)-methyltransferase
MPKRDAYELVDFGDGRKLERFGGCLVDRPAPAAERAQRALPELWQQAQARYERERGWTTLPPLDAPWPVRFGPLVLELRLTDSGSSACSPNRRRTGNGSTSRCEPPARSRF